MCVTYWCNNFVFQVKIISGLQELNLAIYDSPSMDQGNFCTFVPKQRMLYKLLCIGFDCFTSTILSVHIASINSSW